MTLAAPASTNTAPQRNGTLLSNGDRLTRAEFHRRYAAMTDGRKYELIEGVVYMASPVRYNVHGKPQLDLAWWLRHYMIKTPGLVDAGDNATVRLDNDNEVQPDLFLLLPPHAGGRAIKDAEGYVTGPPALVCEIAASSINIDLHDKKNAYRRNGVQEYLVWRTEDAAIDWFFLDGGDYVIISPQSDGTLCSKTFPGLCLRPSSLLVGDLAAMLVLLDASTATPEHAEFIAALMR